MTDFGWKVGSLFKDLMTLKSNDFPHNYLDAAMIGYGFYQVLTATGIGLRPDESWTFYADISPVESFLWPIQS